MPARVAPLLCLASTALVGCADPFAPPPDCPLTSEAVIDVLPVRFARGDDVQLTARWDRAVVPEDLPDHVSVVLLDEEGRQRGAWPAAGEATGVVRDVDVLGQRTFLVDVGVPMEMPAGAYTMRATYTPDPQACPGPEHEVHLEIE